MDLDRLVCLERDALITRVVHLSRASAVIHKANPREKIDLIEARERIYLANRPIVTVSWTYVYPPSSRTGMTGTPLQNC